MNKVKTITVHRGILGIGRRIAQAIPRGTELWDKGLGDLAAAALKRSPIPEEIGPDELLDKLQHVPVRRRKCRT